MLGIIKAEHFADSVDGESGIVEIFFCSRQESVVDEVFCRAPGLGLDQLSEIGCRKATLVGEITDGRQALVVSLVFDEISQHPVELFHYRVVDFLAGDKLPIIETQAVVEKQFDV